MASKMVTASKSRLRTTLRSAAWMALMVGTALNIINQGEAIITGAGVIWWQVALNYCVPFCVSGYSAFNAMSRAGASD